MKIVVQKLKIFFHFRFYKFRELDKFSIFLVGLKIEFLNCENQTNLRRSMLFEVKHFFNENLIKIWV